MSSFNKIRSLNLPSLCGLKIVCGIGRAKFSRSLTCICQEDFEPVSPVFVFVRTLSI